MNMGLLGSVSRVCRVFLSPVDLTHACPDGSSLCSSPRCVFDRFGSKGEDRGKAYLGNYFEEVELRENPYSWSKVCNWCPEQGSNSRK